jgi:hypothetical protein
VISPDLGQYLNPLHTDGIRAFILGLRGQGISDAEIDLMARKNPARMLGLKRLAWSPQRLIDDNKHRMQL